MRSVLRSHRQEPAGEWLCNKALPWFLEGLRPQGFLGRQYAALRPDFPSDPDAWTTEQVLYIAANHAVVKYTPPRGAPFGERWHDLLNLEHLANEVLRSHSGTLNAQPIRPLRLQSNFAGL